MQNVPKTYPKLVWIGIATGILFSWFNALAKPAFIEKYYAAWFYPHLVEGLAQVTTFIPFSITHATLICIPLVLVVTFSWATRRAKGLGLLRYHPYLAGLVWTLSMAGSLYALFLFLWGFNYQRNTVANIIGTRATLDAGMRDEILLRLAKKTNELRSLVPASSVRGGCFDPPKPLLDQDRSVVELETAFLKSLGLEVPRYFPVKTIPPFYLKPLGNFLLQIGNSGIYGPFTGEANIVLPSAPGMLPFTLAHERAHLNGFASETDASVVAFLTLETATDPEMRYAGQLAFWGHLGKKTRTAAGIKTEVEADRQCVVEFWKRYEGPGAELMNNTYDFYLKSQRQKRGIMTYSDATDVVLRYWAKENSPKRWLLPRD